MLAATWAVLVELAPWLLLGATAAGLLHVMIPPDFLRRHLRGRGSVAKAVALGVPLPLCSCGVIPAGLGLKKDGASDGAAIGFLISTPQTGVDSVLVSASFLGWPFALFKLGAAAITGLIGGSLANLGDDAEHEVAIAGAQQRPAPTVGEAFRHAFEVLRTIWRWLVVGVLVSAALTAFVPDSIWSALTGYGGFVALATVLLISLPLYVCATASVPIAAALVAGGFPPGAALVFLMAGPATNIATIGAVYRGFGKRVLAIYLGTIIVGSVALAYAFDFLLAAPARAAAHHHAEPTWWAIASAVGLLGLLAWFAWEDVRALTRRRAANAADPSLTTELAVEGMTCDGCVRRVETALLGTPGVTAAHVELEPGAVRVLGTATRPRLEATIRAAGYTPG